MTRAQLACDQAKAQICGRLSSSYNAYRYNFDQAHSNVANAASFLRKEAASLKHEGCPQLESPTPTPLVMASFQAVKPGGGI